MILRTHFASPFRRHTSASQGLTLESWHIVGLLRLPLPIAGVQLALAEPNVSDELRAIEREGRDLARFPTNRNVNGSGRLCPLNVDPRHSIARNQPPLRIWPKATRVHSRSAATIMATLE
jgi:hypothetical protein